MLKQNVSWIKCYYGSRCLAWLLKNQSDRVRLGQLADRLIDKCSGIKQDYLKNLHASHALRYLLETIQTMIEREWALVPNKDHHNDWPVAFVTFLASLIGCSVQQMTSNSNGVYLVNSCVQVLGGMKFDPDLRPKHRNRRVLKLFAPALALQKTSVVDPLPTSMNESLNVLVRRIFFLDPNNLLFRQYVSPRRGRQSVHIELILAVLFKRSPDLCDELVDHLYQLLVGDHRSARDHMLQGRKRDLVMLFAEMMFVARKDRLDCFWQQVLSGRLIELQRNESTRLMVQRLSEGVQNGKMVSEDES